MASVLIFGGAGRVGLALKVALRRQPSAGERSGRLARDILVVHVVSDDLVYLVLVTGWHAQFRGALQRLRSDCACQTRASHQLLVLSDMGVQLRR